MLATQALTHPLNLLEKQDSIESWFKKQWEKTPAPFYGSVDLRNAGFKLAPIDTNLFPAGFNNLNTTAVPVAAQAARSTIAEICPDVTELLVIPENHSRNTYYFESLAALLEILKQSGVDARVASLNQAVETEQAIDLPSKRQLTLYPTKKQHNKIRIENFNPDYILLNNDLSDGIPTMLHGLTQKLIPSPKMGWTQRLKSTHFDYYQTICDEFSLILGCDPWLFNPLFSNCPEVNFMTDEGQSCLYHRAQQLFHKIQYKYDQYQIGHNPFLVIKADAGTYGMAVMTINNPEEILTMNRKKRTRMSTIKGGNPVTKAIIQEGIPSFETLGASNTVAEPVIYTIGQQVIGGFYRTHGKKGVNESLNSPGMTFSPFTESENDSYHYSVVARLAILAAAREAAALTS